MSQNGSGARRVLVVEDDVMIRMLIEDMLTDLGFAVAAEASKVHEALAARGTPFVFATGYGEHGLPEQFRDRPLLKKPFQLDSLKRMLDAALANSG